MTSPATERSQPLRGEQDETTRSRVLSLVLAHGPVTAAQLARELGLTPAAVRRHLDALEAERIIEVSVVRGVASGAGRPARRYVVAPEGHEHLGNDYLSVALEAMAALRQASGDEAVRAFITARIEAMEQRYRPEVEASGADLADRLDALSVAMSRDGFAASHTTVRPRGDSGVRLSSAQLCQGHCPVQDVAVEYPEFCDAETEMIARLLGVDVRRLSTMAAGAHVCTTHVPLQLRTAGSDTEHQPTARQGGLS